MSSNEQKLYHNCYTRNSDGANIETEWDKDIDLFMVGQIIHFGTENYTKNVSDIEIVNSVCKM